MMEDYRLINLSNELSYETMTDTIDILEYPINNELLANSTEVVKNTYLKLLGVVLWQAEEVNEYQQAMFKGIIAGANVDYEAVDFLRKARQFDENDIKTFVEVCCEKALQFRFVLDSIILSCLSKDYKKQFKLIIEFCKILKVKDNEVEFLSSMAKAIVKLDLLLYANICCEKNKPSTITDKVFYGYYLILQSYVMETENTTVIQGFDFNTEPVEVDKKCKKKGSLALINIDLSPLLVKRYMLTDKDCIILSGCEVKNVECPLTIKNTKSILIINSKFINLNHKALVFESVGDVQIKNVEFNNCFSILSERAIIDGFAKLTISRAISETLRTKIRDVDIFTSGVVLSEGNNIESMILDNCYFVSCGILFTDSSYGCNGFLSLCRAYRVEFRPLITNITCNLRNCVFEDCFFGSKGWNSGEMRMFSKESEQFNCEFKNSPNFN